MAGDQGVSAAGDETTALGLPFVGRTLRLRHGRQSWSGGRRPAHPVAACPSQAGIAIANDEPMPVLWLNSVTGGAVIRSPAAAGTSVRARQNLRCNSIRPLASRTAGPTAHSRSTLNSAAHPRPQFLYGQCVQFNGGRVFSVALREAVNCGVAILGLLRRQPKALYVFMEDGTTLL